MTRKNKPVLPDGMSPKIYIRKPTRVAAMQVTRSTAQYASEWLQENEIECRVNWGARKLHFFTPHKRTLSFGDYLIRNGNGDFYPTKNHNFDELYELPVLRKEEMTDEQA